MSRRSKLRAFECFRPRILTLLLLFLVAVPIALANFTSEIQRVPGEIRFGSIYARGANGWPFIWHWHNLVPTMTLDGIAGWEYSRRRLAANLASWTVMLAVPAAACEWLLRRFRPRFRWSLRTMMVAVAVVAVSCGWFAEARNRANVQDPIIAELEPQNECVAVERPGPDWLEFVVPDSFRRRIVGLDMRMHGAVDEEFVIQLGRLHHLKYLSLHVKELTPVMVGALRNSRQMRWLHLRVEQPSSDSFAALGELTQLEVLYLYATKFTSDDLRGLAGLTNLKMLGVEFSYFLGAFSQMPALPRLEAIQFIFTQIRDQDLRRLSVLPRLKALDLKYADLGTDVDLRDLANLSSLEELTVKGNFVSAAALESWAAVERLRALHITEINTSSVPKNDARAVVKPDGVDRLTVPKKEVGDLRRAFETLRESHPRIVIDSDRYAIDRHFKQEPPWDQIKYSPYKLDPPWHEIESSVLRSTWLPSRLARLPPSFVPGIGQQGSDALDQDESEQSQVKEDDHQVIDVTVAPAE